MSYRCERCGRTVDKLVPIDDAFRSAQYTELLEIPYLCTDYVCITCAQEILGISDEDLIREERLKMKDTEFLLNVLKGRMAQVIIEIIFEKFGYEVYPYGYESYLTNVIKFMRKKNANIPTRKVRATPDLFIYDREFNEGFFIEVKATMAPDEAQFWISQSTFHTYRKYWPEAILVIYCIPSMNIYCFAINKIPLDTLLAKKFTSTGKDGYVINLKRDLESLPNYFRLINTEEYYEFFGKIRDILSSF